MISSLSRIIHQLPDWRVTAAGKLEFDPSRVGVLFFSGGRGEGHVAADLFIAEELRRQNQAVDVRFVSFGASAKSLTRSHQQVIDLQLPDTNPFLETLIRAAQAATKARPSLIVSHEVFAALPAARVAAVPSVFLTDWFTAPDQLWMECLRYAEETIILDDPGYFQEPAFLQGKVHYVGPAPRPFSYSRADRGRARKELNLPEDALVISVFAAPGERTEAAAPIYDLVMPAFRALDSSNKFLVWIAGEDSESLAARTKGSPDVIIKAKDWPFDRLMVASDLAITKANRHIVVELATLDIPSISISHSINAIDDIRIAHIPSNVTLRAKEMDSRDLSECMAKTLASPSRASADSAPLSLRADARVAVAERLARRIEQLRPAERSSAAKAAGA